MAKKITLKIQVPAKDAQWLSIEYHKMAFEADPDHKKIMDTILSNKDKTAEEIRWVLNYNHKIDRMKKTIINMAKKIGLEIKK
jgi:hypothetical protein